MKIKQLLSASALGFIMILALFSFMTTNPVQADDTTYYVATTGSDANDGSSANPWKTIAHAVSNVPAASDGHPNTIVVSPGLYDSTNNGETFPLIMDNANVRLTGGTPGAVIIDGEGTTTVIATTAPGVEISGFTIRNATNATQVEAGGAAILDNLIEDVGYGVNLYADKTVNGGAFAWGDVVINNNTFIVTNTAVYFDVQLDGAGSNANITVGDFDVMSNTFNLGASAYGLSWNNYDVTNLNAGSLDVGDVTIAANEFYSGTDGVYFDAGFSYFTTTAVTAGSIYINDNIFQDQASDGVYMYFYGNTNWYGDSTGTYGDVVMRDNTVINAGNDGLHLEGHSYNYDFYDNAAVTLGDVVIQNNTIESADDGIEYWEYYAENLYDNSSVLVGDTFIQHNTVNVGGDAIYGGVYEFGYELEGTATATMGDTIISNNTLTGTRGIYPYYYEIGYYTISDTVTTIGELTIRNNEINATLREGIYDYFEEVAYEMDHNSQLFMGDHTITDNTISGPGDGVYIEYYDYYIGSYSDGDSYAEMPSFNITNNSINVDDEGIYFYSYSNPDDSYGNALIDLGGFLIDNNTFISGTYGIDLYIEDVCEGCYDSSGAIIQDIIITNNNFYTMTGDAIYLYYDDIAYWFDDTGSVEMGDTIVANNMIDTTAGEGIYVYHYLYSNDKGTATIGKLDINDNQIKNVANNGIYLDYEAEAFDDSMITAGQIMVQDNLIDKCGLNGIYAEITASADVSSTLTVPDSQISQNSILNCENAGIQLYQIKDHDMALVNNVIEGNTYGLHIDTGALVDVVHNTIVKPISPTVGSAVYVTGTVNITNNIILADQGVGLWHIGGTVVEDYNLFAQNATNISGTVSSGGASASTTTPRFVDYANDDYHLESDSPAVDNGVDAGIYVDRDDLPRPYGSGFDMGAYEFTIPSRTIFLPLIFK